MRTAKQPRARVILKMRNGCYAGHAILIKFGLIARCFLMAGTLFRYFVCFLNVKFLQEKMFAKAMKPSSAI